MSRRDADDRGGARSAGLARDVAGRLAGKSGRALWRSLDELAGEPRVLEMLRNEFPGLPDLAEARVGRRRILELMGASFALAGLSGCGGGEAPDEAIPYVVAPPGVVPGVARHFATAVTRGGYADGVIVTHQMGRPVQVEGNPEHPASLGALDPIIQASILDLYDPDRSRTVLKAGRIAGADALVKALSDRAAALAARGGEGLRILSGTVTSPTLAGQIGALRQRFPALQWHRWEADGRDTLRAGAMLAFGRPVDSVLHLDQARVILAVESDILDGAPGHLRYARDFARRRRAAEEGDVGGMSRLYAVESVPTLAGARADHRFALRPHEVEAVVRALAATLGAGPAEWRQGAPGRMATAVDAMARDLAANRGAVLVHAGPAQPAATHALVHAINAALGAPGRTVTYIEPVEAEPVDHGESLDRLAADMIGGRVDTLLVLGCNPVFTAPADLDFAAALAAVPVSVHLGTAVDETAMHCTWHVPEAHEFERWGDARAFDGTVTILQPQVKPLWGGWSPHELLAVLGGETRPDGHAIVRAAWARRFDGSGGGTDEADGRRWADAVRSGVVPDSAAAEAAVSVAPGLAGRLPPASVGPEGGAPTALFRPDPWLRDGRYANLGWLQELPRPFTTLTWDNAVLMAPATAARLGLANEDVVAVTAAMTGAAGSVEAPVWTVPGHAEDCITLPFGFGRKVAGRVGRGVGFDAFRLRTSDHPWELPGVELRRTGKIRRLAVTQHHQMIDSPDLVRHATLDEFRRNPTFAKRPEPEQSLYPAYEYPRNAWAMAINLDSCIGCNACTAACQAENNIAVVGKEEVLRNRQMHWIRIDTWYESGTEGGAAGRGEPEQTLFQPMTCMHCENAPCEVVCPVGATMHDTDGLNVMVYNRCVGTRFCSNNCPYKVRRFNYFNYSEDDSRLSLSWNPDVSVRPRGVMEKCTYCIQRIREARIAADRENRPIRDGEVKTACQQACPAEAIVFGDANDPDSAVSRRQASPLDYGVLTELNTRPRTSYQARLRNPNPEIAEGRDDASHS
ncbi:TAT-variant-translocated molybdopterin oxidoreductase [Azospirillum picis]|uniref:Molybdopterin-containing oxidoreductase family iron-sulfur binding subunit n=1 Tax=Azospirillum picis TaxID=488438 RepID=A0ABU0MRA9_9PROT|nr:TAT-variant-translocated molybdopterin oxidoreductase [Azospirillum picis]MBP2302440.1 molybdopterin-containing oxidoreductase family iron-sulfur binding subunit [Azospirillum picis]MDQ0536019.1 molybdopterin-containing oxidoreductase family iron-sulfur binding subunit [Azospirillum picis]